MSKNKFIAGLLFASTALFTAGTGLQAESGILFVRGQGNMSSWKPNLTPQSGTWRYRRGGFWLILQGGHRFHYWKETSGKWNITLEQKMNNGSYRAFRFRTIANAPGVSYTIRNGKRRFYLTRNVKLNTSGGAGSLTYIIQINRGSVLNQ